MDTIRSFIAIPLPDKIMAAIADIQSKLKHFRLNVRWVRPENIHLTLKFLGDIRQDDIGRVEKIMTESVANYSPMSLCAQGFGMFPGIRRPRVFWTGIGGDTENLLKFQKTLEGGLETIGFQKERREFKGHLTIGRTKGDIDPDTFIEALNELSTFKTEPFVAETIIMYKSDLKSDGPVYTKLKTIEIK